MRLTYLLIIRIIHLSNDKYNKNPKHYQKLNKLFYIKKPFCIALYWLFGIRYDLLDVPWIIFFFIYKCSSKLRQKKKEEMESQEICKYLKLKQCFVIP